MELGAGLRGAQVVRHRGPGSSILHEPTRPRLQSHLVKQVVRHFRAGKPQTAILPRGKAGRCDSPHTRRPSRQRPQAGDPSRHDLYRAARLLKSAHAALERLRKQRGLVQPAGVAVRAACRFCTDIPLPFLPKCEAPPKGSRAASQRNRGIGVVTGIGRTLAGDFKPPSLNRHYKE